MHTPHESQPTPWSDLEARLAGPQGAQTLQDLFASLEAQAEQLQRQMGALTLDRQDYALAEAYADAVEAALAFLTLQTQGRAAPLGRPGLRAG